MVWLCLFIIKVALLRFGVKGTVRDVVNPKVILGPGVEVPGDFGFKRLSSQLSMKMNE